MKVFIKDAFEMKSNMPGSRHAPGLVVVFDGGNPRGPIPAVGCVVDVQRPDGHSFSVSVEEVKSHGSGRSFFLAGLHRIDLPIGSTISWEDDPRSWRHTSAVGAGSDRNA
jgi:hypothetical protein